MKGGCRSCCRDLKESTSCLYQGKCSKFHHWCCGKNIVSCKTTVQQITEFFQYLHKESRLSVPAIKSYRAALNHAFALSGTDLTADSHQ